MSVKKFQKNNTYIDISNNSVFEIKLFLYELRKKYKFLSINSDIDKEIQENRSTVVVNRKEKICYLDNEEYLSSISVDEFKKKYYYCFDFG